MLTMKETLQVYALYQKRVADRRYLCDVAPEDLRIEELCDLIPSAMYADETLVDYPIKRRYNFLQGRGDNGVLRELIEKHRANIQRHETRL
jgi:hypothetical protein